MNYYLIAGVGFREMRTVASKLIDKLSALHGADTVIRAPFGALRFWSHNAEQPNDDFVCMPSGVAGLGTAYGPRIQTEITSDTQHIVMHGPGILNNLETITTFLSSNNSESPTKTRMTVGSTVNTYLIKTNESSSAMALRLQEDWDTTVDNMPYKGTGIVNPTNEDIQASKDAYFAWCVKHANTAANLFGSYDEEVWNALGGWNADGTPSQVGVGITDVTTFERKDGTTANFTNHTHQLYITQY